MINEIITLKAKAYDILAEIQQLQIELQNINLKINSLSIESTK